MRTGLRALATLVLVALIGAGCSNGSAVGTTGSVSKHPTRHAKAVRFAECMRTHGVSAFPDPDAAGDLTLDGVVNGSSLDPSSAAWKQATSACKDIEPPGFTGSEATPTQMSARLEFARCVRDNGVKDFPDPTRDGPLVDTNHIPSTDQAGGMGILNAAMRRCRSFAAKAGVRGSK
jgi:hypothetical protein